jgi:Tfp pilus assembly protein PilE
MNIQTKLILLLIIVIILPVFAGILYTSSSIQNTIEKIEEEKAIQNVSRASSFLELFLQSHEDAYQGWTL